MGLLPSLFLHNLAFCSLLSPSIFRACFFTCVLALLPPSRAASLPTIIRTRDNDGDKNFLPAQIGGIVGSYAISLVLVASILLILSKRRRARLSGLYEPETQIDTSFYVKNISSQPEPIQPTQSGTIQGSYRNALVPSVTLSLQTQNLNVASSSKFESPQSLFASRTPQTPTANSSQVNIHPNISPVSSKYTLGFDSSVDQTVVEADKKMADRQLEEMYRHVLEHEEAKRLGLEPPPLPAAKSAAHGRPSDVSSKKSKSKPGILNLSQSTPAAEKHQSKTSLFKQLLSPRSRRAPRELTISAPIMTPQSATFPRDAQEMSNMAPRMYAPASPPPIPTDQQSFHTDAHIQDSKVRAASVSLPTPPDFSPASAQSIDERLENTEQSSASALGAVVSTGTEVPRNVAVSASVAEEEPTSSTSSQAPLVGLPASPRSTTGSFPALPASPRSSKFQGQFTGGGNASGLSLPLSPRNSNFSRPNQPSAVRTGGVLPLRAYEPSVTTPRAIAQTTFERTMPFSPMGAGTPGTSVPYTPYQPFSPVVPVTPSLVTREERKRMKKMVPKTPTLEMAQSSEDLW
ncbi:hypothetical protein BROUX41_000709 [Berkeleyomyces rouxiae]|uniref:uncharacterized protein n=1 Tax=Berkeleyomyces rouxiae TaxID=2035830 RepID=UPI003B79DE9C